MSNLKKLIVSAVVLLAVVAVVTVGSAIAAEQSSVKSETQIVGDLGILLGDGDGLTDEYLNKPTTRLQAAIMFLRLKGLEADAMAFAGTDNFADANLVGKGGQAVLAYLKANSQLGWMGSGNNLFDPMSEITAQQFYKVMLEALGYKAGMDFEYADTIAFAGQNGLSRVADVEQFKNINIATAAIEVLNSQIKDGEKTLATVLSEQKVLDPSKLDALQYTRLDLQHSAALGDYLVDSKGMTLYYFDKDTKGVSNCSGKCLENWPAFYSENIVVPTGVDAADFATITRTDGSMQTTYKGYPLYYWVQDKMSGDTTGQNVGTVWFVVNPETFSGTSADK